MSAYPSLESVTAVKQRIGDEYVNRDSFPGEDDPETIDQYHAVARRHEHLYEQIPVSVLWTHADPYSSAEQLFEAVEKDDELLVFAGGSHPEYMTEVQNVQGRAVHDYFGHYRFTTDFSLEGEFRTWRNLKQFYPEDTHRVLFTEIVGQRCAGSYLEDGFDDDRFAQRAFPAPPYWIEWCRDLFQ